MTFSTTVSVGSSWKNWKMTPTVRPRHWATLLSDRPGRLVPPMTTLPDVGRSMPVIMFISVDLPDPERPTTAMNSPRSTWRLTDLRARNGPASVT